MANNDVEKRLWEAADQLRANSKLKASEYSMLVLGFIFLRSANFIILYVRGRSEDPEQGAHGVFLGEITGVADEMKVFPEKTNARDLLEWYGVCGARQ